EPRLQRRRRDAGQRELREGAAHVPPDVAVLEAPDEKRIDGGAGNDAELAADRHGTRERPAGYTDAHAALDDERQRVRKRRGHGCRPDERRGRRTTRRRSGSVVTSATS